MGKRDYYDILGVPRQSAKKRSRNLTGSSRSNSILTVIRGIKKPRKSSRKPLRLTRFCTTLKRGASMTHTVMKG